MSLGSPDAASELRLRIGGHGPGPFRVDTRLESNGFAVAFHAGVARWRLSNTPQAAALTHGVMRLQVKDLSRLHRCPGGGILLREGNNAQAHIEWLKQQLQQLDTDLTAWWIWWPWDASMRWVSISSPPNDPEAAGLSDAQIQAYNVELLQTEMRNEGAVRNELAEELSCHLAATQDATGSVTGG